LLAAVRKVIVPFSLLASVLGVMACVVRRESIDAAIAGLSLVLLIVLVEWYLTLARALAPRSSPSRPHARYPSITVVRPVRGEDVGAAANFAAALDTGYPGEVETIFVFDEESDPALPLVQRAIATHHAAGRPGRAMVVVAGVPPPGMTGKLHAMVTGEKMAARELIAFGDSDTRPDRQVLGAAVDALLGSEAGSAFAPIVVDQAPQALGDVFYALMQNALYAPLAAMAAGARRELPFVMGQLMVFRRSALAKIGGTESARGHLVDDMYLGRRLHEAGMRNVMCFHRLRIATGGMTLRDFLPMYRRWITFARDGLPFSFTWPQWVHGVILYVALGALAAAIATGHLHVAPLPALVVIAQAWILLALNRRNGGARVPARWAWAPSVLVALAPLFFVSSFVRRKVTWRGRAYDLTRAASLVEAR
jgi:ceramide glucosyltransferase